MPSIEGTHNMCLRLSVERNMWGWNCLLQALVYAFYDAWWVLPAAGFVVGFATNYLALLFIFKPIEPTKVLCFTMHGAFLRRQAEVSEKFAELLAQHFVNSSNMWEEILHGACAALRSNIVPSRQRRFGRDAGRGGSGKSHVLDSVISAHLAPVAAELGGSSALLSPSSLRRWGDGLVNHVRGCVTPDLAHGAHRRIYSDFSASHSRQLPLW
jgi:hypothetical protein